MSFLYPPTNINVAMDVDAETIVNIVACINPAANVA
jgi:hypothetical protein